jgi:hypothetical protein
VAARTVGVAPEDGAARPGTPSLIGVVGVVASAAGCDDVGATAGGTVFEAIDEGLVALGHYGPCVDRRYRPSAIHVLLFVSNELAAGHIQAEDALSELDTIEYDGDGEHDAGPAYCFDRA